MSTGGEPMEKFKITLSHSQSPVAKDEAMGLPGRSAIIALLSSSSLLPLITPGFQVLDLSSSSLLPLITPGFQISNSFM
jgi:hypothetical protein